MNTSDKVMCTMCTTQLIPSIVSCQGCSKNLCRKHFSEHRDALSVDLRDICDYHNNILQQLQVQINCEEGTSYNNIHDLLKKIDEWEKITIESVSQRAQEARTTIQCLNNPTKQYHTLKQKLNKMREDFKEQEVSESFVETDINQWNHQLNQIKINLDQLSKIKTNPPVLQIENMDWSSTIKILFPFKIPEQELPLQQIEKQLQKTLEDLLPLLSFSDELTKMCQTKKCLIMKIVDIGLKESKYQFLKMQKEFNKLNEKLSLNICLRQALQNLFLTLLQTLVRQIHQEMDREIHQDRNRVILQDYILGLLKKYRLNGKVLKILAQKSMTKFNDQSQQMSTELNAQAPEELLETNLSFLTKILYNLALKLLVKLQEELENNKLLYLNWEETENLILILILELLVGLQEELKKNVLKLKQLDKNQQDQLKNVLGWATKNYVKDKVAKWLQELTSSSSESESDSN
ncbi:hypothetical protein I4U23_006257 [Adineta vaga]|nr:hypothetical protein I4U23_006257 [Adineta vaga]